MPESAIPDVRTELCAPGDVFLLCSDGVTDPLEDDVIAEALALPPAEAAASLVDAAYDAGGADNITALVLRVSR
jgi:serine/threonine protein phosphatase PrpC